MNKPNYPGKNADLALAAMNSDSAASAGYDSRVRKIEDWCVICNSRLMTDGVRVWCPTCPEKGTTEEES